LGQEGGDENHHHQAGHPGGVVLLLVVAFGTGAWLGADIVGNIYGSQALPSANANADRLYRKLLLLDGEDQNGLREAIWEDLRAPAPRASRDRAR
jgi:hypothetical protein